MPGLLLFVFQGVGSEFNFATLNPDELPVVVCSVAGVFTTFKRVFDALP